jgi:threonine-phosphate decarboxylase
VIAKESDFFQQDITRVEGRMAGVDTVFLCNPNNPTGNLITREGLIRLCEVHPKVRFIIDESYLPFSRQHHECTMIRAGMENAIVLHSYSKIHGVPGLRLGFLIASPKTVELFRSFSQPWSVNVLAQIAGRFLTDHDHYEDAFLKETRSFYVREKKLFADSLLNSESLKIFPSEASFLLIKLEARLDASQLCSMMARDRILVRNCSNFQGLSNQFVRIALKSPEINSLVVRKLSEWFG